MEVMRNNNHRTEQMGSATVHAADAIDVVC